MPDIPPDAWSAPWTSSDTCTRHQAQQAEIDLRDWLAGKPHAAFDALKAVYSLADTANYDVAEIGAGCCYNRIVLREVRSCCYVAVDISDDMLEYGREHFDVKYTLKADAQALPVPDGSWHVALLSAVIQHVPDWRKAVSEGARVSSRWVILHRVQCTSGKTNEFINPAYQTELPTRENNETELLDYCESVGLKLVHLHRWGRGMTKWNASYLLEKS